MLGVFLNTTLPEFLERVSHGTWSQQDAEVLLPLSLQGQDCRHVSSHLAVVCAEELK